MMDEGTDLAVLARARPARPRGWGRASRPVAAGTGRTSSLQCLTPHLAASLDLAVDVLPQPDVPRAGVGTASTARPSPRSGPSRDSAEARAYRGLLRGPLRAGPPLPPPDRRRGGDRRPARRATTCSRSTRASTARAGPRASWPATSTPTRSPRRSTTASPAGRARRPRPARAADRRARRRDRAILLLDRPGAAQAVVRVGHVGLRRLDPDYTTLLVLNQILGGQFTSRLNAKLREEKGFTYGVRSHFDCRRGAGPFSVSASLQTDRARRGAGRPPARGRRPCSDDRPPTPAELDDARRALIEGQARHFETPSALVSRYAEPVPPRPPARPPRPVRRAPRSRDPRLPRAAPPRRQLHPEALVAVVVADASRVLEPLRRLEWADVEVDRGLRG